MEASSFTMNKKIVSMAAAAIIFLTSSVTTSAETVNSDDAQEISVTLSVEEFANLVSDYGYSVTIGGSGDIAEPQMHKTVTHTFTDSTTFIPVDQDSVLLNETVQLQNVTFSDNIISVDVYLLIHTTMSEKTLNIGQNGHSRIYNVPAGTLYRIYMKANTNGKALSADNPGTVSFYWTDRSWEVIE